MIQVKQVRKSFGSQVVLDDVNFEIRPGTVTAIIGRSGSGKSVLIRHIIGLDCPDHGEILVDGENICTLGARDVNRVRKRFGILFQDGALFDSLTVEENVAFPLNEHTRLSDAQIRDVVREKLTEVGLAAHLDKFPFQISGGMRKRAGLARALALDPDTVFFDEPTAGLDPITKGAIYRIMLKTHEERSVTYVLVSHDITGVLDFSDEILMLMDGKIRMQCTPDEIRNSDDPAVRQFLTGSADGPVVIE